MAKKSFFGKNKKIISLKFSLLLRKKHYNNHFYNIKYLINKFLENKLKLNFIFTVEI